MNGFIFIVLFFLVCFLIGGLLKVFFLFFNKKEPAKNIQYIQHALMESQKPIHKVMPYIISTSTTNDLRPVDSNESAKIIKTKTCIEKILWRIIIAMSCETILIRIYYMSEKGTLIRDTCSAGRMIAAVIVLYNYYKYLKIKK